MVLPFKVNSLTNSEKINIILIVERFGGIKNVGKITFEDDKEENTSKENSTKTKSKNEVKENQDEE